MDALVDVSTAFAVVYAADGSRHTVCWSSDDVADATAELDCVGLKAVVFHRIQRPTVTNINSGAGFGIQAGVIHGGVRM